MLPFLSKGLEQTVGWRLTILFALACKITELRRSAWRYTLRSKASVGFLEFVAKVVHPELFKFSFNFESNLDMVLYQVVIEIFELLDFFVSQLNFNAANSDFDVVDPWLELVFFWLQTKVGFKHDFHSFEDCMPLINLILTLIIEEVILQVVYGWDIEYFEITCNEWVLIALLREPVARWNLFKHNFFIHFLVFFIFSFFETSPNLLIELISNLLLNTTWRVEEVADTTRFSRSKLNVTSVKDYKLAHVIIGAVGNQNFDRF